MLTLTQTKEFSDGTANYTFNVSDVFIRHYIKQTGQPVSDELIGEFITKMIYEACAESYTKADRDLVKFKGEGELA
jgi:hypothetical protein